MSRPATTKAEGTGKRWLHRIIFWLATPFRLFRQRTSIQMIASYVAVAMIAIVLLQATIISSLFWKPAAKLFGIEDIAMDV
ncbi:MAG: hypothetical protein ACR2OU_19705 [Thermomicrobiales bacterium]